MNNSSNRSQHATQHNLDDSAARCAGHTPDYAMGGMGLHGSARRPVTPSAASAARCLLFVGYCVPDTGAGSGDGSAARLSDALEHAGYAVWLGERQLHGGRARVFFLQSTPTVNVEGWELSGRSIRKAIHWTSNWHGPSAFLVDMLRDGFF